MPMFHEANRALQDRFGSRRLADRLVETRERDEALRKKLVTTVRDTVSSTLGLSPKDVVLLERGQIPRTSSGKLERHKGRPLYEQWLAERAAK